jgi:hypothetical protein
MPLEKACLEAEIESMNSFFLGENILSNVKDKALELWEKFKEWVQGILAKVKVFFAKFAMSRKQTGAAVQLPCFLIFISFLSLLLLVLTICLCQDAVS